MVKNLWKATLVVVLLSFVISCTKDHDPVIDESAQEEITQEPSNLSQILSFKELPSHIQSQVVEAETSLKKSSYANKRKKPFGKVVQSNINVFETEKKSTSYTFGLSSENHGSFYYDNLVVVEDSVGNIQTHIIRYEPGEEWYWNHVDGKSDNNEFSGKVTLFDKEGNTITSTVLKKGKISDDQSKTALTNKLGCTFGSVVYAGLQQGEVFYVTSITITYFCSGPAEGGGYTYPDGNIPDSGGGSTGGGSGGSGGAGGGSGGQTVEDVEVPSIIIMPYKLILDSSFQENEKTLCIYNKLVNTALDNHNIIRQTMIDFSDDLSSIPGNLIYKLQSGLTNEEGAPISGGTKKVGDEYIITLNSDMIGDRSPIEIARTILHESVHAILKRQYNITTNSFVEYFKEYMRDKIGSSELNHAIMRDHYVLPIANNLKQFDEGKESSEFYENLAWDGLHQFLSVNEINDIVNTLNQARERGLNCN